MNLSKIYGPAVQEKIPLETTIEYQNQAYGYDNDNKFAATTKRDKIRKENLAEIEKLKAKFSGNVLSPKTTNEAIQPGNPAIKQIQ